MKSPSQRLDDATELAKELRDELEAVKETFVDILGDEKAVRHYLRDDNELANFVLQKKGRLMSEEHKQKISKSRAETKRRTGR